MRILFQQTFFLFLIQAIVCFISCTLTLAADLPARIALTPTIFEINLNERPTTESLTLFNLSEEAIDVAVSINNWTLDEQQQIEILPPTSQSLDQWMIINPLQFNVPAKGRQVIRFSVRPRAVPEPGEHRAIIYLSEVPAESNSSIQVTFKMGVAVYGYADPLDRSADLKNILFDPVKRSITFGVTNKGNAHVRLKGQYTFWKTKEFLGLPLVKSYNFNMPKEEWPTGLVGGNGLAARPVLPGMSRSLVINVAPPPEPGSYILAVKGKIGDVPFAKKFSWTIK